MKKFICFVFLILSLVATIKADGEKFRILSACEKLFGKSLDEKLNLFEVNQKFVLQPEFNQKEFLVKISVLPKHFYEETRPDWSETGEAALLSKIDYEAVNEKINAIKPPGKLLRIYLSPAITNSTAFSYEFYENARLEYGEAFYFDELTDKERVRFIRIVFFQEVSGKIKLKKSCSFCEANKFLVSTGAENFYVEEESYKKLKKGKFETFRGIVADNVNLHTFGKKLKLPKFKIKKD